MAKLKVKYRDNQIIVISKLDKTEEINQQELAVMQSKIIRGLMKPRVEGARKISYIAPNGITLKKYLTNSISKNDFFLVFAQILEAVKSVDRNSFNVNNLVSNVNYSFINERTKEVHFIYQPVRSQAISSSLASFLYDVAYSVNLELAADYNSINQLLEYMKSLPVFSIEKVEEYILRVYPQVYKQVKRQKPGQSQMLSGDDLYYQRNQMKNQEKNMQKNVFWNFNDENIDTFLLDEGDGTALLDEADENETTLLADDFDATSLLTEEDATSLLIENERNNPYLIKINSFDRIDIDRPVFKIGKERSCVDFFIQNNSAVSRLHADIVTKDNRYFIKDNHSTNHTFVNDESIPADKEIEIFDGDTLKFANEIFEFHVD